MKAYRIIILAFVLMGFGGSDVTKTKVKISPKSEVVINGRSNVNTFQCKYNSDLLADDVLVTIVKGKGSKISLKDAKIAIKSKGFDCANKIITNDFKVTLKSNQYESIDIELKELDLNNNYLMIRLNIEIAGKEKEYVIPMAFNKNNNNVKGTLRINIKDFDLKSPKKLFGMISVDDNVDISFNLFLQY